MILCHCAVVSDHRVRSSVEDGAGTLSRVCADTGAGQQCGTCVFSVRRVLTEHREQVRERVSTIPALSEAESEAS